MAIKKVLSIICIFLLSWQSMVYATPFRCDLGSVYTDKNSCDTFCSENIKLPCEEIEPSGSGTPCDTANYKGFVYIDGKTFAITKNSVTSGWASNAAVIRNDIDNLVIVGILKSEGVQTAWIGASDPFKTSTAYDSVDASRFKWKDGASISYSAWKEGQPDNAFNSGAVGVGSLYGEYWAVIDSNGEWSDVGLNSDGSEKLFPAFVEWNGALSCVTGIEKNTSSLGRPSGMVCGKEDDKLGFNFQTCSEGGIFGGDPGFLCPIEKTACNRNEKEIITDETRSANFIFPSLKEYQVANAKPTGQNVEFHAPVMCSTNNGDFPRYQGEYTELIYGLLIQNIGGGKINVTISASQSIILPSNECWGGGTINYPPYSKTFSAFEGVEIINPVLNFTLNSKANTIKEGETLNTGLISDLTDYVQNFTLTATIRSRSKEISYSCPHSGRPCIADGGGYFCSPNDCADGASSGNYQPNPDETKEGANDANNDGAIDSSGNCLGRITIFPGEDSRCRQPGTQSSQFQCCKIVEPEEANKPDFHLPKLAVAAMLYFTGFAALAALFALVGPDGFDFKVCSAKERQLWVNRGNDLCYDLGSYCAETWQGSGCVQRKKTFCCFDSEFSRAFNEAGMEMLARDWGSAENPKCGGFTPEELQTLSAMNISDHPKMREFADKLGEEYADKMQKEFNKTFNKDAFEGKVKQQIEGLQP